MLMVAAGFHLFDTAFGVAGLAWRGGRVAAVAFPQEDVAAVAADLNKRAKGASEAPPPPAVAEICDAVADLFAGGDPDFSDIDVDDDGAPPFDRDVWRLARAIPLGETRSYGDLAKDLGDVAFSQRVGQALGRNPFPIIVPCHRVIGAGGAMTGFSTAGGVEAKRRLLKLEGALPPELFD